MPQVQNRKHILDLRDALHAAISTWGVMRGIGPGDLHAPDACVALAMVMRDIVQAAPDDSSKAAILTGAVAAITGEMARPQIIVPNKALHS